METNNPFEGMSQDQMNKLIKAIMQNMPNMPQRPQQPSQEVMRESAKTCALTARILYEAYIDQGFNSFEALDLTKLIIGKEVKKNGY